MTGDNALKLFARQTKVDIVFVSGILTVTVHPTPQWFVLFLEIALFIGLAGYSAAAWRSLPWLTRVIFIWGEIAAIVSFFYQLSGSEVIEFDSQNLRICKEILGWERRRSFDIDDCKELDFHHGSSSGDHYALRCKAGWRTIRFAEYASEDQVGDVLSALHRDLPQVAIKLQAPAKTYTTTLGLGAKI